MNKIINNLTLIADAAEYFDKKTGAAWKIRSSLTNMGVWAANAYLYAVESGDSMRQAESMITLGTIRVWLDDCNRSSLMLDLTSGSVRKTLGLERVTDVHADACREARTKCIQTRSSKNFKKYYDASVIAFEKRRIDREEKVESIAYLLSDSAFSLNSDVADQMQVFLNLDVKEGSVSDKELYDENNVITQSDTIAECVGNALEAMCDVCEGELASAITTDKINRLTGYHRAIMQMMEVAGVDTKKLAERRAKLEAQIEAEINDMTKAVGDIDSQIEAEIAAMGEPVVEAPAEPVKPARRTIKAAKGTVTSV